jgi:hypothetical protein
MRFLGAIVMVAMLSAIAYGFVAGSGFGSEGSALLGLVWGQVTVIDLYLMLGVFAVWIWSRETSPLVSALWTIALVLFGSVAAGAYLLTTHRGSAASTE